MVIAARFGGYIVSLAGSRINVRAILTVVWRRVEKPTRPGLSGLRLRYVIRLSRLSARLCDGFQFFSDSIRSSARVTAVCGVAEDVVELSPVETATSARNMSSLARE